MRKLLIFVTLFFLVTSVLNLSAPIASAQEPEGSPAVEPTEEQQAAQDPTDEPTDEATTEPEPTDVPTDEATAEPEPTDVPTDEATTEPDPTDAPTDEATTDPDPTDAPTDEATAEPEPTDEATAEPEPTDAPTDEATAEPTAEPPAEATPTPTETPTAIPTIEPTVEVTPTVEITTTVEITETVPAPSEEVTAQAITAYESCFQLQNLEDSPANTVDIYYYEQNDTNGPTLVQDTLPANGQKNYCPLTVSNFNGSVQVTSDKKLASISNLSGSGNAFNAYLGSYKGVSGGGTQVVMPILFNAFFGYTTWFNVQALNQDVTVNITYDDGVTVNNQAIKANEAKTFNQGQEGHAAGWYGSGSITSNGPIAVTVVEVGPAPLFVYNGFVLPGDASTTPVAPIFQANSFGYFSGWTIMNTSGGDTNVTVTFVPASAGTACTETLTVPAGKTALFGQNAFAANDPNPGTNTCVNGQTFVGAGYVTANSRARR
jgi:hypothetical protein